MKRRARRTNPAQRGAAILLAMLILALVSTVAAAMAWHQHRAIEVEAAERARTQASWMLTGAFDAVSRVALRTVATPDTRVPLELKEASIAALLAADRDNNADTTLDAYISGIAIDAQGRYNLRNLLGTEGKPNLQELAGFARLCDALGLAQDVAPRLAEGLAKVWGGPPDPASPLAPTRLSQLAWFGVDPAVINRLERYVVILPVRTPVNAGTAEREVLVAAIDKLDLASAGRIARAPLKTLDQLMQLLPEGVTLDEKRVGVGTRFFEVTGAIRLEQRVLQERVLVERRADGEMMVLQRERLDVAPQSR